MNSDLAMELDYTESDLQINRDGKLSDNQHEIFKRRILTARIALALFLLLIIFLTYDITTALMQNDPITPRMIRNTVLLGLPSLYFVYQRYQNQRQYQEILASNEVQSVYGAVWKNTENKWLASLHYVGIGTYKFFVKSDVYNVFVEDELYTLYFADDKLLSAEQHSVAE